MAIAAHPEVSPRTRRLLGAPIVPTLVGLAWPNTLVTLAQASTGLIELFWVSRLGTDALAGLALVFPGVMLMQMVSNGAMGGGISSAVARSLGAGRRERADALVVHAVLVNLALGALFTGLVVGLGPTLYRALGGEGGSLQAALLYSNVVFGGAVLIWVTNGLASVIRGTGNVLVPALVIAGGVVVLVPLSPCLIFGAGPFPALGVAGGAAALVLYYAGATAVLGWYVISGRCLARPRRTVPSWPLFADILRVGAVSSVSSLQTNLTVILTTALVGTRFGPDAVAGYGTGARLEYLLVPLVFGLGAPLVALVGTNTGAGQGARALRIAFAGGGIAFGLTEAVGLCAALWPQAWLGLFGSDPAMLASGSAYLHAVGPFYGFFGLGLALYFASQGRGRLAWPLIAGALRVLVAVGGGWLALRLTGSLQWLFVALGAALVLYGTLITATIAGGAWSERAPRRPV